MAIDDQQLFAYDRIIECCVFCGEPPKTKDHLPSKVLLDTPFPSDRYTVPACAACNNAFSLDEEYLACLVEVARVGSTVPSKLSRTKIGEILAAKPSLATRIAEGLTKDSLGRLIWAVEYDRVNKVIVKLARGHLAYEVGKLNFEPPQSIICIPFVSMSTDHVQQFENGDSQTLSGWPEVGTRAFFRAALGEGLNWIVLQPNRYRFQVEDSGDSVVRIVLSEYLACEVRWSEESG